MHEIEHRLPSIDEHRRLAASVGWEDHFDGATIGDSIAGSLHGVVVIADGTVVGMGRIVGDGVHYFYLQDVIVDPAHADDGHGSRIVDALLEWIAVTAPSRAFVGLFASPEAEGLYREFGFDTHDMTGMHRDL
jgi:GNAT superfamily N-acetyltransferase